MNVNMAMNLFDVGMRLSGWKVPKRENMYEVEDAFKMLESIGKEDNVK